MERRQEETAKQNITPPPVPLVCGNGKQSKRTMDYRSMICSSLFHFLTLIIIANIYINIPEKQKPIAIELSFAQNNPIEDITIETIAEISVDANDLEELIQTQDFALDMTEIETPSIEPEKILIEKPKSGSSSIKDIPVEDLVEEIIVNNSTIPVNTVSSSSNILTTGAGNNTGSGNIGDGDGGNGDILKRLASAGARTGDVQVSISWDNTNDIDLWVEYKRGYNQERIGWQNRQGNISGGWLDVDRNAIPQFLVNRPIENIFWLKSNTIKYGYYTIYLNYYRCWDLRVPTKVKVRIKIGKEIINKTAVLRQQGQWVKIHGFLINNKTSL